MRQCRSRGTAGGRAPREASNGIGESSCPASDNVGKVSDVWRPSESLGAAIACTANSALSLGSHSAAVGVGICVNARDRYAKAGGVARSIVLAAHSKECPIHSE